MSGWKVEWMELDESVHSQEFSHAPAARSFFEMMTHLGHVMLVTLTDDNGTCWDQFPKKV